MIKQTPRRQFIFAVATLIGMIVGAGTFGLPYVSVQSGFWLSFFYLFILGAAVWLVHLIYGEIILRTQSSFRLVGYTAYYLGNKAKILATFVLFFEYYGALLAYLILGGNFLRILFSFIWQGPEWFWSLIFYFLGILAVIKGLKTVERSELFMAGFLLLMVGVLLIKGWNWISLNNFSATNWSKFFLPYGVFLFALAGSAAVPEMRQIMRGEEKRIGQAIFWGTFIPVILYFLIIFAVVGISGPATTENALEGLMPYLGKGVLFFGSIFGVLAVFTSFLVLSLSLKNIFHQDYKIKPIFSYFLTFSLPLLAYFAGLKDFILVIGLVGAIASSLDGLLMVLIFLKARKKGDRQPEFSLSYPRLAAGFLMMIFFLGLIYQFVYFSTK